MVRDDDENIVFAVFFFEDEEQVFIAKQMDDMGRGAPTHLNYTYPTPTWRRRPSCE